jgi:PilZ domain
MATQSQYESRRSNRKPLKKIAHLFTLSENEIYGAGGYTLDLSAHGSRVHTILDLVPGQIVEFHPDGSENAMMCRVAWSGNKDRSRPDEVGLEFLGSFPTRRDS